LDAASQYQLWLIRNGQRINGAVFSTDEQGYRGVRIEASQSLLEFSSVDITVEPAGGSTQPTGDLMLTGSLIPH
jgi:anti-sigma-K factor RskA